MELMARMWNHIIAAFSAPKGKGHIPGMPEPPRAIDPHEDANNPNATPHTWKSHGGFRH